MKKIFKYSLIAGVILATVVSLTFVVGGVTDDDTTENPAPSTTLATSTATTSVITTTATVQPTTVKPEPTVGKVKNLKKTSLSTSKITLKWSKVKGATGYIVYYRNADKSNSFTNYKVVKSNTITFKKLLATTPYYFKVGAYVQENGEKYVGDYTLIRTATQPSVVTKVKATSTTDNIKISWNKNSKATGYKIYRNSTCIKTIKNKDKTSYTDKSAKKGVSYTYKVRAYRTYKATGATYNSDKSAGVTGYCGLKTVKAKTKSELYKVNLSWSKQKYADGYLVYQSSSKNGKFKRIGISKSDYYLTDRLSNNKTYYYKVVAYKKVGSQVFTAKNKIVSQKVSDEIFGTNVGGTYIEVSIKQQHMWYYVNGKLYVDTDVVTGNDDGVHNTPKGVFSIFYKESPSILVGDDYRTKVTYWMPFTSDGCGIHDSTWRADWEYGGTTYKGDGSHGCVNTPYSKVKKIYNKASAGTKVIVH
jgi:fibronectin type 3 domain-containing protein